MMHKRCETCDALISSYAPDDWVECGSCRDESKLQAEREKVRVLRERLQPFANFACSPPGECDCENCAARDALATTEPEDV